MIQNVKIVHLRKNISYNLIRSRCLTWRRRTSWPRCPWTRRSWTFRLWMSSPSLPRRIRTTRSFACQSCTDQLFGVAPYIITQLSKKLSEITPKVFEMAGHVENLKPLVATFMMKSRSQGDLGQQNDHNNDSLDLSEFLGSLIDLLSCYCSGSSSAALLSNYTVCDVRKRCQLTCLSTQNVAGNSKFGSGAFENFSSNRNGMMQLWT